MYSVYIATHTIVWALDILNDMDMIKTIWKTIICKYLISKSVRVKINCSAILANVREVNIYPQAVIFVFSQYD